GGRGRSKAGLGRGGSSWRGGAPCGGSHRGGGGVRAGGGRGTGWGQKWRGPPLGWPETGGVEHRDYPLFYSSWSTTGWARSSLGSVQQRPQAGEGRGNISLPELGRRLAEPAHVPRAEGNRGTRLWRLGNQS